MGRTIIRDLRFIQKWDSSCFACIPNENFRRCCPLNHGYCLEGIAGWSQAIEQRTGKRVELEMIFSRLGKWSLLLIANALMNNILSSESERIVLGGGVMKQANFSN